MRRVQSASKKPEQPHKAENLPMVPALIDCLDSFAFPTTGGTEMALGELEPTGIVIVCKRQDREAVAHDGQFPRYPWIEILNIIRCDATLLADDVLYLLLLMHPAWGGRLC